MSSMIIPIGFGGAGASGGGSFIQIYADAPQYIEGKYLRVSLGGDEIYADSIPTNVDALTLQITEAGTYTIAVYASSSASTATESHTVLVDTLTASPSVRIGDAAYVDIDNGSVSQYYYVASNTQLSKSGTLSGTASGSSSSTRVATWTYTPSYEGILRFKATGTVVGTPSASYASNLSISVSGASAIDADNQTAFNTAASSINSVPASLDISGDFYVKANTTVTFGIYVSAAGKSYSATASDVVIKICGTRNTATYENSDVGIKSKIIKSLQFGTGGQQSFPTKVNINTVNPNKSIIELDYSHEGAVVYKRPENPNYFYIPAAGYYNYTWILKEFY